MKPTELRIGNYGDPYRPYRIIVEDILEISKGKRSIPPVPLTEQWLKDFRYKKDTKSRYGGWLSPEFKYHKIRITIRNNKYYHNISRYHSIEIKYVHQLQNLYFALTGKELTK